MKRWYVVQTKPHCEGQANASLIHLNVETFLPLMRERYVGQGGGYLRTTPLFPGYLFVCCEVETQYRAVSYARGVKRFVSFGTGPIAIDEAIVEAIKGQLREGVLQLQAPEFEPGQRVRFMEGPLYGLEAVFQRKLTGAQRAVLLLKTVSYQARVVVDTGLVANL